MFFCLVDGEIHEIPPVHTEKNRQNTEKCN